MDHSSLRQTLHTFAAFSQTSSEKIVATSAAILTTVTLLYLFRKLRNGARKEQNQVLPPHIPSPIPYIGHAVEFGKNPINFLMKAYKEYGSVFSFTVFGKTLTYAIGPRPCAVFFNSKNEDLNAEEVYAKLITPLFGKGVAFDVPNEVFMEQKKMLKTGLSSAHYRRYVPLIEKETKDYFQRWGNSGERDLFTAFSELLLLSMSRCLHGKEIRERLDEHVAQVYVDLNGGLSHLARLLPRWLPLPSFRKRDKARLELKHIFGEVIRKRRENPDEDYEDDVLNTLMHASYKDGRQVSDDEITGMLIGALLAGQHTSSSPSSWLGFFLAREKKLQNQAFAEQIRVRGEELPPLEYDQLKHLTFLDCCLKETLRLRPPVMTMMRMVKTPQVIQGFTVPVGHQICVSSTVNQRLEELWEEPESFNPNRFLNTDASKNEKFAYIPFGAGRHRCIGESLAYVMIKTIWSVLLQKYEFDLVDENFPPVNYSSLMFIPAKPIIKYKRRQNY